MSNYKITLSIDTIGMLDEGGLLEEVMYDQLAKIVNEEDGDDLFQQLFLARKLVALADLAEAIRYDRRKDALVNECNECGGMGHTVGFLGKTKHKYPCESC